MRQSTRDAMVAFAVLTWITGMSFGSAAMLDRNPHPGFDQILVAVVVGATWPVWLPGGVVMLTILELRKDGVLER